MWKSDSRSRRRRKRINDELDFSVSLDTRCRLLDWSPGQHNVIVMWELDVLYPRKQLTLWSGATHLLQLLPLQQVLWSQDEAKRFRPSLTSPGVRVTAATAACGHKMASGASVFCCFVTRLGCADRQVTHAEATPLYSAQVCTYYVRV